MKDLKTFPSSESSRKSSRQQNVFEFTMNPRAHQEQQEQQEQQE